MVSSFKYKNGGPGTNKSDRETRNWRSTLLAIWGLTLTILYLMWPEDDSVLAVESITKAWQCEELNPVTKEKECIHEQCNGVSQNYQGDALVFDVNAESKYPFLPVLSANQCCKACRLHPNCNVWTYCRKEEGCGLDNQCVDALQKNARVTCNKAGRFAHHSCTLKLHHEEPGRWQGEPMFSQQWVSGHINRTQFGLVFEGEKQ